MKLLKVFAILLVVLAFASCGQGQKFVDHTVDVDTAFGNYEWFHTTYQDIQAMSPKIKLAYDMYQDKTVSGDTKTNYQTNYTGLVNILNNYVAEYNAKSSMWNRSLFKDKKLPYKIKVTVTGGDVRFSDPDEQ